MLSEEKIKKMIRLSEYEKGQGSTDLKRVRYLRMDYVRLRVLKSVVSIVLAAFLILALFAGYHFEYILENALSLPLQKAGFITLGGAALGGAVGAVLTWRVAARQYDESAARAKEYYATLQELLEMYEREEHGQEVPPL